MTLFIVPLDLAQIARVQITRFGFDPKVNSPLARLDPREDDRVQSSTCLPWTSAIRCTKAFQKDVLPELTSGLPVEDYCLYVIVVAGLALRVLDHDTRRAVTRPGNMIVVFTHDGHLEVWYGMQDAEHQLRTVSRVLRT